MCKARFEQGLGNLGGSEYLRFARLSRAIDDRRGCEVALDLYRKKVGVRGDPYSRTDLEPELLLHAGRLEEAYRRITLRWCEESVFSEPLRAPLLHIAWLAAKGESDRARRAFDFFRPYFSGDLGRGVREIPFLKEVAAHEEFPRLRLLGRMG